LPQNRRAGRRGHPRAVHRGGLVSILFGIVLFARPNVGAVTLALLFGLFALIYGFFEIMMGIEVRRTGKTLDSVVKTAA